MVNFLNLMAYRGFPGSSDSKESVCNAGDTGDAVQSLGQEHLLGEGIFLCRATGSSILAWRTPGTEEPGRL